MEMELLITNWMYVVGLVVGGYSTLLVSYECGPSSSCVNKS